MNIVKFQDYKVVSNGERPESEIEAYNKYFRGKYCYAIHADHVVAMKSDEDDTTPGITLNEYIEYERDHNHTEVVLGLFQRDIPRLNYSDWEQYVDKQSSPMFQKISHYIKDNEDFENASSLNKLKNLRTQIANLLVNGVIDHNLPKLSASVCPKKWTMLEYYASNMTNDIIENLSIFQKMYNNTASLYSSSTSGCGCNGVSTITSINTLQSISSASLTGCGCGCGTSMQTSLSSFESLISGLSTCDLVNEYRKMIKMYMIENFSDIEFWKYVAENDPYVFESIVNLLKEFAGSGLSIFSNTLNNKLDLNYSCHTASSDSRYTAFASEMGDIASAFEYIKDGDFSRSTFIKTCLTTFAYYYEYLQWNGYVVYTDASEYENYD